MKRRGFFQRIASGLLGLLAPRWARAQAFPADAERAMNDLANVVLPDSLGAPKRAHIAAAFIQWVRDYKPGAQIASGYGFPRTQVTGPSPAKHYADDLQKLALSTLEGTSAKRSAVAKVLEEAGVDRIPQRPAGKHVAADLLAFFYGSSEGEDFLYGVAIRRDECRGLSDSSQRPKAIS